MKPSPGYADDRGDRRSQEYIEEGAMQSDAFRAAVEALDLDATVATLAQTIVFRSPVRDEPLRGRDAVRPLFAILLGTFEDLRFLESFVSAEGGELLHFQWRLGDRQVEGVDMLHFDKNGLIDDYAVMIRPLSALVAMRDAVFSQLSTEDRSE